MNIKLIDKQLKYNRNERIRKRWWFLKSARLSGNVSGYCRREGVKRSYYHFWFKRLRDSGWDISSLSERSRRPKTSPNQTSRRVVEKIKRDRKKEGRGALAIGAKLNLPASTVGKVLKREGLILEKKVRKKRKKHPRRYELERPGEIVQVDVKYVPKISGRQYYQFTAIDDCSRWRYCRIYRDKSVASTKHFVMGLIEETAFTIECIQTDHGSEFTNTIFDSNCTVSEKAREHVLDRICKERGIRHKLIPVGQCEVNGKVERSHRTDEQEFYARTKWRSYTELGEKFNRWLRRYNERRLHGGIGWKTPAQFLKEKMAQPTAQTV
ncbi:MAG: IS481 family transposase [Nitrospinota bacterium]